MSSGKLIAEYTTASSKIESDASQITNVSSKLSTHPNPKSAEEMGKLIKSRTQEVLDAWTSVYERQKKIFVWPSELQEDFLSQFRDKTPIELTVQFPTEPEVESSLRKRYELYIGEVLPGSLRSLRRNGRQASRKRLDRAGWTRVRMVPPAVLIPLAKAR